MAQSRNPYRRHCLGIECSFGSLKIHAIIARQVRQPHLIRQTVWAVDRDQPLAHVITLDNLLDDPILALRDESGLNSAS
jgi:hypothetical protein